MQSPGCKSFIDYDNCITILPLSDCTRYARLLADRHLLANNTFYVYCPNAQCGKLLRIQNDGEQGKTFIHHLILDLRTIDMIMIYIK